MTEHPRLAEAGWDQTLRAMDYLAYAYLPGGQDREAKRVLGQFLTSRKRELESLASAYAPLMCRAIGSGRENGRSHFGHFSVFRRARLGVPSEIAVRRMLSATTR